MTKYVLFHFLYDSSDLLTKSKILAFLNIPRWLGLMGFQNKWIGFLNLSKYRARGLFRLEQPAPSADPQVCRLSRSSEGQLISNLLFFMEAEVIRTKK